MNAARRLWSLHFTPCVTGLIKKKKNVRTHVPGQSRRPYRARSGCRDPVPLHEVLHLPVLRDPSGQDAVPLAARHAPGRAEVAADGAPEEAELGAWVQALCNLRGGKVRERGVLERSGRSWLWDLWVGRLQGSSWASTTSLHRGLGGQSLTQTAQTAEKNSWNHFKQSHTSSIPSCSYSATKFKHLGASMTEVPQQQGHTQESTRSPTVPHDRVLFQATHILFIIF